MSERDSSGSEFDWVAFVRRRASSTVGGLAVASFLPYIASWHYIFELFVHFRHVYMGAGLALAPLLLVLGDRRWIFGALAIAAFNAAYVVPWYLPGGDTQCAGADSLRVALVNVRASNTNYDDIRQFVEESNADVLVVLEYSRHLEAALHESRSAYPYREAFPRRDNFGVALFSKLPMGDAEVRRLGPAGVPQIRATLRTSGGPVRFWAVHPLPPVSTKNAEARDAVLQGLAERASVAEVPFVVAGDLNTTMGAPSYAPLRESGLRNARDGDDFGLLATWPSWFPVGIPIDHVLHSQKLRTCSARLGTDLGSDHRPLVVELKPVEHSDISELGGTLLGSYGTSAGRAEDVGRRCRSN